MAWVHHVQKMAYVKLIVKTGETEGKPTPKHITEKHSLKSQRMDRQEAALGESSPGWILQLMLKNEPLTELALLSAPHLILNTSTLSTEAFNIHPTLFYLSYEAPGTAPDGICPSFCNLPGTA